MTPTPIEDQIQAIRWRLGFPTNPKPTADLQKVWEALACDTLKMKEIVRTVVKPLQEALLAKMSGPPDPRYDWAAPAVEHLIDQLQSSAAWSPKIDSLFRAALEPVPKTQLKPAPAKIRVTGLHPDAGRDPLASSIHPEPTAMIPPTPAASPPATWQYKPVPDSPAPFPESAYAEFPNPPAGYRGFGARVRGKKHKHEGTNCDDSFAFERSGDWTVIAVADGAGSKKLSRIGAAAATKAATRTMLEELAFYKPAGRSTLIEWQAALTPGEGGAFPERDLEVVRKSLIVAMRTALDDVEKATTECGAEPEFAASLGRVPEVGDFSCTLLLAIVCAVQVDGKPRQLVMACQVGDGMIGAIHRDGRSFLLGIADSGAHAGETEFLTSAGKTEPEFLNRKTTATVIDLQALMVMTDGVADDYFPADLHLARLWGDLVVNGIPELNASISTRGVSSSSVPAEDGIESEVIEPDPRTKVTLSSSAKIAERLGTTAAELVKSPANLWAGRRPIPGATPEERLRLWLDAYHVRGSFDDRTLVCIHREDLQ